MECTIRIDGNSQYDYAKETLTLIDDVLYVVETDLNGRLSLHLLNEGYILLAKAKYSDNVPALLRLIIEQYANIVKAMKICQETGKTIANVGYVEGLTVSDW